MRENRFFQKRAEIDISKLKVLIKFFPIGEGLRYSPGSQLAVILDTIIVGYCVDNHFIYSRSEVQTDGKGHPSTFLVGEEKTALSIEDVRRFQLLVPDTTDLEGTLDYDRRALIGRSRQFLTGSMITLMVSAGAKGVLTLTTEVANQVTFTEGPYTNNTMILLKPELNSLKIIKHLHKSRGKAKVPVDLYFKEGSPAFPCIVKDFSESHLGLCSSKKQSTLPPMKKDDEVMLVINLGEKAKTFAIKGRIFRRSANACVIHLKELFKGREYAQFSQLDTLELKTGLLNYAD